MASRRELRALITIAGRIDPSLQSAMLRASGQSATLARNTQRTSSGLNSITGAVTRQVTALAGSLAAVLGVQKIIDTADAWTTVRSRVGLVTSGIQQQQESLDAVYSIAQKTRQSFQATGDLYTKIAMNAKQLGLANGQVLQITDTVNKALKIGGGTTQTKEAAIMQLSQALSSGRLQGDELRAVTENAPRLAKAIADGLGVTIGSLKKFGSEGALTADVIIAALRKQGKVIDQEFTKLPTTIREAFTYFNNAFGKFVDDTGKETNLFNRLSAGMIRATDMLFVSLEKLGNNQDVANAFTTLGNSIQWARDNSNWLIPAVSGVFGAMAGYQIISTVTGLYRAWTLSTFAQTWAQHGLNAAMRANPIGIIVTVLGLVVAAGVAVYENWDWLMAKGKELFAWISKVSEPITKFFGDHSVTIQSAEYSMVPFASGGIATRPSIFGEAGPEMAIPLERTSRSIGLLQQTASILGVTGPAYASNEGAMISSPGQAQSIVPLQQNANSNSQGNMGAGAVTVIYSPNVTGGSGPDIEKALGVSFEQFKSWAEQYFEDKARVAYGQ